MTNPSVRKIGNVKILEFPESKSSAYSDGEVENQLLEIFQSKESEQKRQAILEAEPRWPEMYHLSYGRENILSWMEFKKKGSALEFGGGCGALTGVLTRNFREVVSIELSSRRSKVMATRHRDASNLTIVAANIMTYEPESKFDAITAIGTVEYSPSYIHAPDPVMALLTKLRSMLAPGGSLVIAIENKFGLKYWTGAAEDHTGAVYESIHDYPNHSNKVLTFSRKEMKGVLDKAGFKSSYFYYPYPDYKLPILIYSDDYYPGKDGVKFPYGLLPAPGTDRQRELFMSEPMAMRSLEKAGLFREFSNSFLVVANA
jgi:SAM-dependent methyltransferase